MTDYADKWRQFEKLHGSDDPDETIPAKFALHHKNRRVQILQDMDATAPSTEIDHENEGEMRRSLERANLRWQLGDIHEKLLKNGR